MSSGHSPGDFCSGFCSCGDLFSETDNELSMQHAYPVHQEISDEILPMHYGRTFTREWKKRVKPAQLSSIRDLTQLNDLGIEKDKQRAEFIQKDGEEDSDVTTIFHPAAS